MKMLVLSVLMIVALGAGSVFAVQNDNSPKKTRSAAKAKPTSGGSSATAGGAASGGAASGGAASGEMKKSSGKKHHRRKHRRHSKKS